MAPISGPDGAATAAQCTLDPVVCTVPYFQHLSRIDLARMVGEIEELAYTADTLILRGDAPSESLYILVRGRVKIGVQAADGNRRLAELEAPAQFGEPGLLLGQPIGPVRALTDVQIWRLPGAWFDRLLHEQPALSTAAALAAFEQLGLDRRAFAESSSTVLARSRAPAENSLPVTHSRPSRVAGLAIATGVPFALWWLPPPTGLDPDGWLVLVIVLGAALGWLLEPIPDYLVALVMAGAWGVAGLAAPEVVLAGFGGTAWIVSLGAFGLAVAMIRSGLLFRVALLSVSIFPATPIGQVFALLLSGILVTPFVPLGMARIATVAPLARDLAQVLGYPARSHGTAALAFAGLVGYGLFSSVFLTGLVMNFFVLDLLPQPDRERFGWLNWLACAVPAGAIVLLGTIALLLMLFPVPTAPPKRVGLPQRQLRMLGALSSQEHVTLLALSVLLVGLLGQPIVRIDAAWLAIGALAVVTIGGSLTQDDFRREIDWGFLILFGILLGTGSVLQSVGVDTWIASALIPLATIAGSPTALVLVVGLVVIVSRLALPWIPATLLLSLALVPVGQQIGLSPWVVGFVVLTTANTWLHPNQAEICRLTRDATGGAMFTNRHGVMMGAGVTLLTLVAMAASVPYWQALGVLGP